ncbi:MAG: HemK/PrmC family methyltransferase [Bacillota bacterium]|nr:HemK/PrmC family methyltransferase [Bacillota bacterium]
MRKKHMTRKEWIQMAQNQLEAAKSPTPRLDAEVLLAYVQQVERIQLHMYPERVISDEDNAVLEDLVSRRTDGEPVAYLTGTQEFMGLTLHVSPAVLIPRPDTELLVETTLENLKGMHCQHPEQPLLAADIGTGSGCIAVTLAVLLPQLTVLAVDLSTEALAVAGRNCASHGVKDQVIPLQGNLLEPVREWLQQREHRTSRAGSVSEDADCTPEDGKGNKRPCQSFSGKLDAIISNPPYITEEEMRELPASVVDFEPHQALAGGTDGLDSYRQLTAQAPALLRSGGLLAFEIGYLQADAVADLMKTSGFVHIQVLPDLAGHDRVVLGRMP